MPKGKNKPDGAESEREKVNQKSKPDSTEDRNAKTHRV
jgi:hypothetical protein